MGLEIRSHDDTDSHYGDSCILCSQEFRFGRQMVGLFEDGELLGNLCPLCRAAGPAGISERVGKNVERIRRWADRMTVRAEQVAQLRDWVASSLVEQAEQIAADHAQGDEPWLTPPKADEVEAC